MTISNFTQVRNRVNELETVEAPGPVLLDELFRLISHWRNLDDRRVANETNLVGPIGSRTNRNSSQIAQAISTSAEGVTAYQRLLDFMRARVDAGDITQEQALQHVSKEELERILESYLVMYGEVIPYLQRTQTNVEDTLTALRSLPGPLDSTNQ